MTLGFNFDSPMGTPEYDSEILAARKLDEFRAKFKIQNDNRDTCRDNIWEYLNARHRLIGHCLGVGIYAFAKMCREGYYELIRREMHALQYGEPITWEPLLTPQERANILGAKPYHGPSPAGNERQTMLAEIAKKNENVK